MTYPRSGCHPSSWLSGQSLQACGGMGGTGSQSMGYRGGQVGVSASLEGKQSSSFSGSGEFSLASGPSGLPSLGFGGPGSFGQRCDSSSFESMLPGVLWAPFRGTKSLGGMETSFGSIHSEPLSKGLPLQNGVGGVNTRCDQARRLGSFDRSQGRLLSHSDPQSGQEISEVHVARESVPICCSPFWSGPSSLAFLPNHTGAVPGCAESGHSSQGLSGRLAPVGKLSSHLLGSNEDSTEVLSQVGVHSQQRKIGFGSLPGVSLFGDGLQYSGLGGVTLPSTLRTTQGVAGPTSVGSGGSSQTSGFPSGYNGVHGTSSPSGPTSQETDSTSFSGEFGIYSGLVPNHRTRSSVSDNNDQMEGRFLAHQRSPYFSSSSTGVSLHRRLTWGLGSPHGRSDCSRAVGRVVVPVPHQRVRDGGGGESLVSVQRGCSGQTHTPQHGQYNSCLLLEQAGGVPLSVTLTSGGENSSLVPGSERDPDSSLRTGKTECTGRLTQSIAHDSSLRMDSLSQCSSTDLGHLVQTSDRSFCYKIQQKTSSVCLSGAGPTSVGSGCLLNTVEESGCLCLPSLSHNRESTEESKGRRRIYDSSSSVVGGTTMVSRPSSTYTRKSSSASARSKVLGTTKDRSSSRKSQSSATSRMDAVRDTLSAQGASKELIELIEYSHSSGTQSLYKARWNAWLVWCSQNKVDPLKPSHIQFGSYLAFLFEKKKLSASTVKGHRSAISTTLTQLGGPNFSDNPLLKDISQAVSRKQARTPKHFPPWDLYLVLKSLRCAPYEPLRYCPLDLLSYKTVFLVSLASGRRCSEVHALQYEGWAVEPDKSISLKFLPEFVAKNQPLGLPSPPICIKALTPLLCPDDEDRTLCPVRALKIYIERTKFLRSPLKRRLFVSIREDKKSDISRASVSRWIKNVIKSAYDKAEAEDKSSLKNTRAHEIRAWASSIAWANNTSLQDIMQAAYWFGRATFFQFYLRDVSNKKADGSRGISMVAAQQVCSSKPSKS